jgi:hypothetical protein
MVEELKPQDGEHPIVKGKATDGLTIRENGGAKRVSSLGATNT